MRPAKHKRQGTTSLTQVKKMLTCENISVWEDSVEKTNSWKSLSTAWIRLDK